MSELSQYKIQYIYDTGDSFHSEENVIEELEPTWTNIDICKANLQRIAEHYSYYQDRYRDKNKDIKNKDWFVEGYEGCLRLQLDNGNFFQFSAPWCGYFERLKKIAISLNLPEISF